MRGGLRRLPHKQIMYPRSPQFMIPVGEKAEVTLTKLSIFLIAQFLTISYIYPLELLSETRFKNKDFY
ncbi:MAG: hypothetical protein D6756_09595 [Cyanobacteria bacterium J083]|nr:MAG: hypothetical protein D6756_09595 [Cyanobacteria bacterium J083]